MNNILKYIIFLAIYAAIAFGIVTLAKALIKTAKKSEPVKCSGDTPYPSPDDTFCQTCPEQQQLITVNNNSFCGIECADNETRCGTECHTNGSGFCDVTSNPDSPVFCERGAYASLCPTGSSCKYNPLVVLPGTTNLTIGSYYKIITSDSNFTDVGSNTNTNGEIFKATSSNTNSSNGTLISLGPPILAKYMVNENEYYITEAGSDTGDNTSDFTKCGSQSNDVGTVFTSVFTSDLLPLNKCDKGPNSNAVGKVVDISTFCHVNGAGVDTDTKLVACYPEKKAGMICCPKGEIAVSDKKNKGEYNCEACDTDNDQYLDTTGICCNKSDAAYVVHEGVTYQNCCDTNVYDKSTLDGVTYCCLKGYVAAYDGDPKNKKKTIICRLNCGGVTCGANETCLLKNVSGADTIPGTINKNGVNIKNMIQSSCLPVVSDRCTSVGRISYSPTSTVTSSALACKIANDEVGTARYCNDGISTYTSSAIQSVKDPENGTKCTVGDCVKILDEVYTSSGGKSTQEGAIINPDEISWDSKTHECKAKYDTACDKVLPSCKQEGWWSNFKNAGGDGVLPTQVCKDIGVICPNASDTCEVKEGGSTCNDYSKTWSQDPSTSGTLTQCVKGNKNPGIKKTDRFTDELSCLNSLCAANNDCCQEGLVYKNGKCYVPRPSTDGKGGAACESHRVSCGPGYNYYKRSNHWNEGHAGCVPDTKTLNLDAKNGNFPVCVCDLQSKNKSIWSNVQNLTGDQNWNCGELKHDWLCDDYQPGPNNNCV